MLLAAKKILASFKKHWLKILAGLNFGFFLFLNVLAALAMFLFLNIDYRLYLIGLLQFYSLLYLIILAFPIRRLWYSVLPVLFLTFLFWVIEFYFLSTRTLIDFPFLYRNFRDFPIVARQMPYGAYALVLLSLSAVFFLVSLRRASQAIKLKKHYLAILLIAFLASSLLSLKEKDNNHLLGLVLNLFVKDPVIGYYQDYYSRLVGDNAANREAFPPAPLNQDYPGYLDNVVILQLESINQELVSEAITPNLYALAQKSFYFENFYANSTQTIFAQENILCGLPTSFNLNLVQTKKDQDLLCLPQIFNALGFDTIFAKTFDLNFTATGRFMSNIGFKEVLADELMQAGDPYYQWGWREDVFYRRFFEYVANRQKTKNFWFLEIGPTNHWPFAIPQDISEETAKNIPFPEPLTFKETLANTVYIQDRYLGTALVEIENFFQEKNYTLLVLSDHSWPLGGHAGNFFNQKFSYEENFRSPLLVHIKSQEELPARTISSAHSLLDIYPSIAELLNIRLPQASAGTSFVSALSSDAADNSRPQLLIQAYGDRYLNIIKAKSKWQYNAEENTLYEFDLVLDPEEARPKTLSSDPDYIINFLSAYLD